jgi:hypothetical protein
MLLRSPSLLCSLEAQLAKNAKMRVMYKYQSFIFDAIVGIDCCSFSSLPVRSKLPTATESSTCMQEMISFAGNDILYYKVSPYSNIRLKNNNPNIQTEV